MQGVHHPLNYTRLEVTFGSHKVATISIDGHQDEELRRGLNLLLKTRREFEQSSEKLRVAMPEAPAAKSLAKWFPHKHIVITGNAKDRVTLERLLRIAFPTHIVVSARDLKTAEQNLLPMYVTSGGGTLRHAGLKDAYANSLDELNYDDGDSNVIVFAGHSGNEFRELVAKHTAELRGKLVALIACEPTGEFADLMDDLLSKYGARRVCGFQGKISQALVPELTIQLMKQLDQVVDSDQRTLPELIERAAEELLRHLE